MPEAVVRELSDQVWERILARDPAAALRCGRPVDALPRGGPGELADNVSFAAAMLRKLAGMGGVQAAFLRDHLEHELAEEQRFWYRFPVTPYNAMMLSGYRSEIFGTAELRAASDADRYLKLLDDYAAVVEQMGETMAGQRSRGIRLPAWAVPEATATIRGHADASSELVVSAARRAGLAPGPAGRLADGVPRVLQGRLAAAFQRLLADLSADEHAAGEQTADARAGGGRAGGGRAGGGRAGGERAGGGDTGIGQYPGGAGCYAGLIRLHTGLDLSADEIHATGLAEVERITEAIRDELGITDEAGYRAQLAADPAMYAQSPADVERIFSAHIDRLVPVLPRYFSRLPAAPFRLRPLEAALSGLTYGYYDAPSAAGDGAGYYCYNVANLPERPLLQAASVIYHEGMPGHHLQHGLLMENTALHPIRRVPTELRTFALNGYLEGWAEYAAGFCDEIGLYADPVDRYGRLSAERFQAARLVLDTGLNVLGWSRERAAAYLRVNGFMAEAEIDSELLRYAIDDPGQALAYHLGHWYLRKLRGSRDAREFHDAVLAEGPLPLAILGQYA
jgi:uncharacterized protein (DUF885 family)